MSYDLSPLVSLGMPVYNGQDFLCDALDALLAQTYSRFEIIISDNASTDGTPDICKRYQKLDERINYIRQPKNVGAGANFNLLPKLASTEFFKWAAHDDLIESDYLSACIQALDNDPGAVLCHSFIKLIDGEVLLCPNNSPW